MKKICQITGKEFEITDEDLRFYEKMGVPTPTLCPEERARKRQVFRSTNHIHKRKCDATGEVIFSNYRADVPFPIYSNKYWWSDKWDPKEYGQDFDFNKPFFEQFQEILHKTPCPARSMNEATIENSDYCAGANNLKDCYFCFGAGSVEKSLYCQNIVCSYDCVDCFTINHCENCYEVNFSDNCSFCKYLIDCRNCNECSFCADMIGCNNCFMSVGLRNKQYYFENKKLSKEEWETKIAEAQKISLQKIWQKFLEYKKNFPVRFYHGNANEDVTGDYLDNCKNVRECFCCSNLEDSAYCSFLRVGKNYQNQDVDTYGENLNNCYQSLSLGTNATNILGSFACYIDIYNLCYCYYCLQNCHDLFGCVGMRHTEYCILNKQYTKEEYEELVPKIIEHMKQTGEWGEFFPIELSPFGYNETFAQETYPLTKDEALARGCKWQELNDKLPEVEKVIDDPNMLPENIAEIPEDVLNWAIRCERSQRPFKIQKLELEFYRKNNLPLPHLHPDERHKDRLALKNPQKLYHRTCDKPGCSVEFETTYAPDQPEKVYCEKCYLESLD